MTSEDWDPWLMGLLACPGPAHCSKGSCDFEILTHVMWNYNTCKKPFQSIKDGTKYEKDIWCSLTDVAKASCALFSPPPSVTCGLPTPSHILTRWSLHIRVLELDALSYGHVLLSWHSQLTPCMWTGFLGGTVSCWASDYAKSHPQEACPGDLMFE